MHSALDALEAKSSQWVQHFVQTVASVINPRLGPQRLQGVTDHAW